MKARFFKKHEYACKCGCGFADLDDMLLAMLDNVRELLGRPVVLTNGCRCQQHNADVGGSATSSHIKGLAVDIAVTPGERWELDKALKECGFKRIIHYHDRPIVHVDIDYSKTTPWLGVL